MGIFHRKNKQELTPADTASTEAIMHTLEILKGLDPREVMLVGSAALVLYGAELSTYDSLRRISSARPGDLDLAATGQYTSDLYQFGVETRLGNLMAIPKPEKEDTFKTSRRKDTIVQLQHPALPLQVDIITGYHDGDNLARYDRMFRDTIANSSRPLEGSRIRIATPAYIQDQLSLRVRGGDPKARSDLARFNQRKQ